MRGKHNSVDQIRCERRITPAGAGKTTAASGRGLAAKDHPRRCGENFLSLYLSGITVGSPPQVRGKPPAFFANRPERRITPAGAGKTTAPGEGSVVT